jgi:hypothetical protein
LSGAHWFILIFFGGLLVLTLIRWSLAMRRFDREDDQIKRWMKEIEKRRPPP